MGHVLISDDQKTGRKFETDFFGYCGTNVTCAQLYWDDARKIVLSNEHIDGLSWNPYEPPTELAAWLMQHVREQLGVRGFKEQPRLYPALRTSVDMHYHADGLIAVRDAKTIIGIDLTTYPEKSSGLKYPRTLPNKEPIILVTPEALQDGEGVEQLARSIAVALIDADRKRQRRKELKLTRRLSKIQENDIDEE